MKLTKRKNIIIAIIAIIILIFSTAFGIFHYYYSKLNYKSLNEISSEMSDDEKNKFLQEEQDVNATDSSDEELNKLRNSIDTNLKNNYDVITNDNVINILLIGTDTREKNVRARSDAMIVLSINKETKKIIATSTLRDIYVEIPGHGKNKLNAAYAFGGVELLEKTLEQNFKININRYIIVDFFSFVDIVNILGGVNIDISQDEMKYINEYLHEINYLTNSDANEGQMSEYGLVKLNGKQALSYSRIRYIGTDFGRTERQRKVLQSIFEETKNADFLTLNKLCSSIFPLITTDLTESEILGLLFDMPNYKNYELVSNYIPYEGTYDFYTTNKMSVIGIDFEKNIKLFNETVYNIKDIE